VPCTSCPQTRPVRRPPAKLARNLAHPPLSSPARPTGQSRKKPAGPSRTGERSDSGVASSAAALWRPSQRPGLAGGRAIAWSWTSPLPRRSESGESRRPPGVTGRWPRLVIGSASCEATPNPSVAAGSEVGDSRGPTGTVKVRSEPTAGASLALEPVLRHMGIHHQRNRERHRALHPALDERHDARRVLVGRLEHQFVVDLEEHPHAD